MRLPLSAAAFILLMGLPFTAHAQACQEHSPAFAAGAKFAGDVRRVIDGQTICVGRSRSPASWFAARLSDLESKNAKSWGARRALTRLGLGKYAVCTVTAPTNPAVNEPVNAVCRVAGVSLGRRVTAARR